MALWAWIVLVSGLIGVAESSLADIMAAWNETEVKRMPGFHFSTGIQKNLLAGVDLQLH